MPPVYVKGGVWTNVEDEILKAAVSKYGLNQWSRVSSLLAKKSARQAKARWNEWLDPSIRRSDWTKEEDEKLLHLAKLLPNQWRSIAPIVGRTASQCVERYQKLLDDAEAGESSDLLRLTGAGIEALPSSGPSNVPQVGDLNINPESKPARPDAVEMDDDEKEMLSEARARLANTQGKKAKRKARERMLDESRRIALLQKRRELKQAGIKVSLKSRNKRLAKQFDYNADIPHEHQPQQGLYDVSEETQTDLKDHMEFERGVLKHGISNKEVDDKIKKSQDSREKEKKRSQLAETGGLSIEKTGEMYLRDEQDHINKRRKLLIPEPQVSNHELEDIVKIGNINRVLTERYSGEDGPTAAILKTQTLKGDTTGSKESLDKSEISITKQLRKYIRESLLSLPKPKNKFELLVPNDMEDEIEENQPVQSIEEDEGERVRIEEITKAAEKEKERERMTQVIQKSYPLPQIVTASLKFVSINNDNLQRLVDEEIVKLIQSDYSAIHETNEFPIIQPLSAGLYSKVQQEMTEELELMKEEFATFSGEFKRVHTEKAPTLFDGINEDVAERLYSELANAVHKGNELQTSIKTQLSSHMSKNESLVSSITELSNDYNEANVEYDNYLSLLENEKISIELRSSGIQERVDQLVQAEHESQHRYRELQTQLKNSRVN